MSSDSWVKLLGDVHAPVEEEKPEIKARVIGVGLPGTGTASLAAALRILGFDPVLSDDVPRGSDQELTRILHARAAALRARTRAEQPPPPRPKKSWAWLAAQPGVRVEKFAWEKERERQMLAGVAVEDAAARLAADTTACLAAATTGYAAILEPALTTSHYAELLRLHGRARVILTVARDSAAGWETTYGARMRGSLFFPSPGRSAGLAWRAFLWPVRDAKVARTEALHAYWRARYGEGGDVARAHAAGVREYVWPTDLLIMDVREGWPRLCDFLGVPVPAEEFPHVDDTAAMRTFATTKLRQATWLWLGLVALLGWVGLLHCASTDECIAWCGSSASTIAAAWAALQRLYMRVHTAVIMLDFMDL